MTNIWYVVKGRVTDGEAHEDARVGDIEWQISDGPPGKRSISQDFTCSLEEALRLFSKDYPEALFNMEYLDD